MKRVLIAALVAASLNPTNVGAKETGLLLDQLTYSGYLLAYQCWCGVHFAVPQSLDREYQARRFHQIFCPLGHSMIPSGRTLPEQLKDERTRSRALSDQLAAAERTQIALRGHLTRLRQRIAAGICPWCKRHFNRVEAHVRSKHPEYLEKMKQALVP